MDEPEKFDGICLSDDEVIPRLILVRFPDDGARDDAPDDPRLADRYRNLLDLRFTARPEAQREAN